MTKPKPVREITMAEIEDQFQVSTASYWFGTRWCPAVNRLDSGCFMVRVVKSTTVSGDSVSVTYDSFDLDADGTVLVAPRGHAKDFKPGRVVDIDAAAERFATPQDDAMRIGL